MEVREQLVRLIRLQELVSGIREATTRIDEAPARLEGIEQRFRERNAEYVVVKERHHAVEADQRSRQGELVTLEEQRKKYMDDLMQVQNQREYAAMLREIDGIKAQIGEHETAVLKDMEELETLTGDLASHESHIAEERERVAQERAQVEADVAAAREMIATLQTERDRLEGELPDSVVALVRRLERGRHGVFLSPAEDGVCQSCFVRVRPQVFQEIRLAAGIHTCGNCRRLLYHPPSIPEGSAGGSGDTNAGTAESAGEAGDEANSGEARRSGGSGQPEVRSLNGGAVS